jgi:general secretion pathway protein J
MISRDLEQVVDRPIKTVSGTYEGFIGTTNSVTFTHAGMDNPLAKSSRSTLQRTRYQLNDDVLRRYTWPVLDLAENVRPDARVLLDSVTELRFEYLDNKGTFQTSWPLAGQKNIPLPLAVRVSIVLRDWGTITQLYLITGQPIETPT